MEQPHERREAHQQTPKVKPQGKSQPDKQEGQVRIDFYTDPLCCWSWAFERSWRKLLEVYGEKIRYRYIMCGMIADWNTYNDPFNAVSRPLQMGPVWMHASQVTHVKMRYDIWHTDPPSSSYPACIAVKTAGLQSENVAEEYLFLLRRSLMEEGANIAKTEILISIAEQVQHPQFDLEQFRNDLRSGRGKSAFREDLQNARFNSVGRFPTLTFVNDRGQGIMIVGYRPFEALQEAFHKILEESKAF